MKKRTAAAGSEATAKKLTTPVKIAIIVLAVLVLAGGITAVVLKYRYDKKVDSALNIDTYYNGISVAGIDLSGKTKEEAKQLAAEAEPALRENIDITLTYGDKSYHYTQDDFDFTYDTDEVLEKAYELGRTGSKSQRYKEVLELQETPKNLEITATLDDSKASEMIGLIAGEVDTAPVDPHTEFNPNAEQMFVSTAGQNGYKIDQEAASASFLALLNGEKTGSLELPSVEIPFTGPADPLADRTKLLSTFSTTSTNDANGNHNMALALQKINGTVLNPGETFSYNGTIGNSTNAKGGWREAGALLNGKTVMEYGGGVCQASTTLYGAVLRADLKVTTRYNHRWPSSYVKIGQDATVSYPGLDFQFQNNYDTPIYIQSYMSGKVLTIKIYGKPSTAWDTIEVVSQQTETIPAPETIREEDPTLPAGTEKEDIKSRNGSKASGSKVYYKNGQEVKREAIASSYYKPVQGVIKVGTMVDPNAAVPPPADPANPANTTETPADPAAPPPVAPETPAPNTQ